MNGQILSSDDQVTYCSPCAFVFVKVEPLNIYNSGISVKIQGVPHFYRVESRFHVRYYGGPIIYSTLSFKRSLNISSKISY